MCKRLQSEEKPMPRIRCRLGSNWSKSSKNPRLVAQYAISNLWRQRLGANSRPNLNPCTERQNVSTVIDQSSPFFRWIWETCKEKQQKFQHSSETPQEARKLRKERQWSGNHHLKLIMKHEPQTVIHTDGNETLGQRVAGRSSTGDSMNQTRTPLRPSIYSISR